MGGSRTDPPIGTTAQNHIHIHIHIQQHQIGITKVTMKRHKHQHFFALTYCTFKERTGSLLSHPNLL
jgi:hypothetical protein